MLSFLTSPPPQSQTGNGKVNSLEQMLSVTESPEESKEWKINCVLADPANMKVKKIRKAPWEMSQLSIIWGNHSALDLKPRSKRLQDTKLHLKNKKITGYLSCLFINRRISSFIHDRLGSILSAAKRKSQRRQLFFFIYKVYSLTYTKMLKVSKGKVIIFIWFPVCLVLARENKWKNLL